jgi:lysophospholipase L1-like esterase
MRNANPRPEPQITWAMLLAMAAAMVVTTSASALAEPATSARPPAARKLSYHDFRRGVFALSKVETIPIVMLGDSLTEAAPWDELTGCRQLVNRGIGGDTTKGVLARLDEIIKLKPRAVFLMIGVNDISLNIAKDASVANLRAILTRLDRADIRSFAAYVLPVAASYRKKQINKDIAALNAAITGVFAEHPGTQVIDLRPQVRGDDGYLREDLSYDGLHLDAKGYAIWRDAIGPHVARHCE